jgi:ribosome-associated protein
LCLSRRWPIARSVSKSAKKTKKNSKPDRAAQAGLSPAHVPQKLSEPVAAPQPPVPAAKRFAIEAAKLMAATRCHQVVVLDVSGISPVCDYLVLATGTSSRQMRSVADDVVELGAANSYREFTHAGYEGETWICLDFIDIVVHLFNQESRMYYDLDNLWGDAKKLEWENADFQMPNAE